MEDDEKLLLQHCHPHPLRTKYGSFFCALCNHNEDSELCYFCITCNVGFHKICAESPQKIIHPHHPAHSLTYHVNYNYDDPYEKCSLCHEVIGLDDSFYRCSLCNFSIHCTCKDFYVRPLIVLPECYDHKLAFRDSQISLPCNVCGLLDGLCHYKCIRIQCGFRVHEDCIYLPRDIKITCHQHRLSRVGSLPSEQWSCGICHGEVDWKYGAYVWKYGAYVCNEGCSYAIHLRCATTKDLQNDENPIKPVMDPMLPPIHLHLLSFKSGHMSLCEVCYQANETKLGYYYCELCKVEFHEECAKSSSEIKFPCHHHPLRLRSGFVINCQGCSNSDLTEKRNHYYCNACSLQFHVECIKVFLEIKHSLHPRHPLKAITSGVSKYSDGNCHLCGRSLLEIFYHCSICNFSLDPVCAKKPPPRDIYWPKIHEHMLTLLPRLIFFTCNACGLTGDRYPYVCCQCDFMVHRDCVDLPRIIKIIRHHHRLSHTSFLPRGNWSCRVCRQEVDGKYGEYPCYKGCGYVAHSKCATRDNVWDGKELESESEELNETDDVKSFKVIDGGLINHCSHEEHDLRLYNDTSVCDEDKHCEACALHVLSDPFYSCVHMDCQFILHERCADLPKKIRHISHRQPLTLSINHLRSEDFQEYVFNCSACLQGSSGFKYRCLETRCDFQLDIRCALVSEPFFHGGHEHPLFFPLYDNKEKRCGGCGNNSKFMLNCIECDFVLDFKCATLPFMVRYKYDKHLLNLCNIKEAIDQYWCGICEEEIDSKKWFYTSDDCGFTSHVECVLGKCPFIYMKPGQTLIFRDHKVDLVPNNRIPRQLCYVCHRRCLHTIAFKASDKYLCSLDCLSAYTRDTLRLQL